MDIDSLMLSALASPNEDVSRDVDPAAKGSDYVTSCLGYNFTPGTNARPTCFRIANIPSTWSKSDLLGVFQTVDPFLNDHKYCLSLYPACYHLSQTALLSLDVCTTYFQSLKPDESSYLRTSDGTVLVVDSHFYHLTPLNTPDPRSEIELVSQHPGIYQLLTVELIPV